jgi:hypothetical protein
LDGFPSCDFVSFVVRDPPGHRLLAILLSQRAGKREEEKEETVREVIYPRPPHILSAKLLELRRCILMRSG